MFTEDPLAPQSRGRQTQKSCALLFRPLSLAPAAAVARRRGDAWEKAGSSRRLPKLVFAADTARRSGAGPLCRELACVFPLASPSREIAARLWRLGLCAEVSLPETAGRSRRALVRRQAGGGVGEANDLKILPGGGL
ncbi:protein PIGBOS1 isoform X2 [Suricata suricatta]|uniref:protein PIGBOS1 isoform X2 n=1 Tax=Suricata suricatta TaxID=37032 RepID=UPI0011555AF3|nr:protein PIGBOS1 isoform X2 [Suricata suricatta]